MPASTKGEGGLLLVVAAIALIAWAANTHPAPAQTPGPADVSHGLGRVVNPLPQGRISSGFGARTGGFHYGLDISAPLGTPILAVADATVIEAGPATGFGLWVRIRHGDGTVSVYGHMNTITTRVGAHVSAGQQIATVGARGQATGPHLHIEIWLGGDRARRVDPAPWLRAHGATAGRSQ